MKANLVAALLITVSGLSACTLPSEEHLATGEPFDPYESRNRSIHAFNKHVDRLAFGPASRGYSNAAPEVVLVGVSGFARNLSMPRVFVNGLLQGDLETAGLAVARFLINTTIGFGGIADPATDFGIAQADTDFGETLHKWGFQEGAYVELPFLGPSNERDALGTVVDLFSNPLAYISGEPLGNAGFYAEIIDRMGDRGRYSDTVESILYESEDSYAQSRLIFLQNRRFELGQEAAEQEIDPFELDTEGF